MSSRDEKRANFEAVIVRDFEDVVHMAVFERFSTAVVCRVREGEVVHGPVVASLVGRAS